MSNWENLKQVLEARGLGHEEIDRLRNATWPISLELGALRRNDGISREAAAFSVHCEDRLIQDAIIPEKVQTALSKTILKKDRAQAGAA